MDETEGRTCLKLLLRINDHASFDAAVEGLQMKGEDSEISVVVDDLTPRGAFDTEFIVALVLSFPIGIAGSLVSEWLLKRLRQPKPESIVIIIADKSLALNADDTPVALAETIDKSQNAPSAP